MTNNYLYAIAVIWAAATVGAYATATPAIYAAAVIATVIVSFLQGVIHVTSSN